MKYQLKQPDPQHLRQYKEICIGCGEEEIVSWPKALPIPNMTDYFGKPSWFQCHILKSHYFYPEIRLDKIA